MNISPYCRVLLIMLVACKLFVAQASEKPKMTLDEFFNSVDIKELKLSPEGEAVVIGTERADWEHNMFRRELWLYRDGGPSGAALAQFTQGGRDTGPQWSPDGKWIAFLSERKNPRPKDEGDSEPGDKRINQLYVISLNGGEAIPLTRGKEEVHAFGWSRDSRTLYFATRNPWTKAQKDAYQKDWIDVLQYRAAERGDTIFGLDLADEIRRNDIAAAQKSEDPEKASDATPGARPLASAPWRVQQMVVSPDGHKLAFVTSSISERQEKVEQFEIFLVNLATPSSAPIQLTNNRAVEQDLRWSLDGRHIFFNIEVGDATGPYRDLQPHLYWVDTETRKIQQ